MPSWSAIQIRFKWFLICLVFFILPFFLISFGLGKKWNSYEADARQAAFSKLDSVLLAIRARDDSLEYLRFLFDRLADIAYASKSPKRVLKNGIRNLRNRFPGVFKFYVVDENGDLIPGLSEPNSPKAVLQKLYKFQRKVSEGNTDEVFLKQYSPVFKRFLGPQASMEVIKRSRQLDSVAFTDYQRFFCYVQNSRFGFYAHFSQTPNWNSLAIDDSCARFRKSHPGEGIEVGTRDFSMGNPSEEKELNEAIGEFRESGNNRFTGKSRLIFLMPLGPTLIIWASLPVGDLVTMNFQRVLSCLIGTFLFSVFAYWTFRTTVLRIEMEFSIRWQLVLLFGFAGGLPLAGILLSGWDYTNQTYKNRIRETHDEGEKVLRAFDARFPQFLGHLQTGLTKILRSSTLGANVELGGMKKLIDRIQDRFPEASIRFFDREGKVVLSGKQEIGNNPINKFLEKIIRKILRDLNQEEVEEAIDTTGLLLEMFSTGDNPLSAITRNLGSIANISLAGNETWYYAYPLRNSLGKATHMAFLDWSKSGLEKMYINRFLFRLEKTRPNMKFYITQREVDFHFPKEFLKVSSVQRVVKNVMLSQTTCIATLKMKGKKYLVTGIRPKELSKKIFLVLQPEKIILDEISLLKRRLWLFSGLSALISIFLGFLLAERFLIPIGRLTIGVEAIRKRDFHHRLPRGEKDELGELAATFNKVIEGLSDLEVAKTVQESLFPPDSLSLGTYQIYGKSRAMTDIGGDYLDYFKVGENKIAGLIGDVSGHGIGAALVMGMAKCAFTMHEANLADLLGNMTNFNKFLLRTIKKKKMMTLFHFSLDVNTHSFEYTNGGHNFPFYFSAGTGSLEELELETFPLGMRLKVSFSSIERKMEPGDTILFYTDGFVEASNLKGEVLDYDRGKKWFREVADLSPIGIVEELKTRFDAFTTGTEPGDDMSLICLKRLA